MTCQGIEHELRELLAARARPAALAVGLDDDLPHSLELDSLASLRLLAVVEKHFDARFPDERLAEYRTLRKIIELLADQHPEKTT